MASAIVPKTASDCYSDFLLLEGEFIEGCTIDELTVGVWGWIRDKLEVEVSMVELRPLIEQSIASKELRQLQFGCITLYPSQREELQANRERCDTGPTTVTASPAGSKPRGSRTRPAMVGNGK